MRNLTTTGKKKSNPGWSVFVAVVLLGMVAGGFFTAKNLQNKKSVAASADAAKNQVSVAVVKTDVETGSALADAFSMEIRDRSQVPEDAITDSSVLSDSVAVIPMCAKTVLTAGMTANPGLDEVADNTNRVVSVNYIVLDDGLQEGDYIDVRLKKYGTNDSFSYSDDVVLAKKKVLSVSGSTVSMSLSEREMLTLGVAAVDAVTSGKIPNAMATLYSTRYVNAAQEKAVVSYENTELSTLIETNPNLIANAQKELSRTNESKQGQLTEKNQESEAAVPVID